MKRVLAVLAVLVLGATSLTVPVRAQLVVYDPVNYIEAVQQYLQIVREYDMMLAQIRRVPVDIATRYHAHSIEWTLHTLTDPLVYAEPLLRALNEGDPIGKAYRDLIDRLEIPTDVFSHMPPELRRRLISSYSTVELADSIARLAINQTGAARTDGPFTLQAIRNVEHDIANPGDDFHSQTALLEKINAAEAIALRVGEQTNQFQLSTLEQQTIETKRKRDTEAAVMNATIYQWRYGQAYGADLFRNTATDLDGWRPY